MSLFVRMGDIISQIHLSYLSPGDKLSSSVGLSPGNLLHQYPTDISKIQDNLSDIRSGNLEKLSYRKKSCLTEKKT
jgi:hypothetical protein